MVILDFSKAFDTVPYQKLPHKMRQYGVDGNINAWLCDFLTNRKMRVVIDGEESEAVPVDSGVPQSAVQSRRRVFKSGLAEEAIECQRHERGRAREGDHSPSLQGGLGASPEKFFEF